MPKTARHQHQLEGLQPQPLASYLTALGVLRLVHEQNDDHVAGFWSNGHFVLETSLSRPDLLEFFLAKYQPTPLTSPWNGGSGYFQKDNKDGFNAILQTTQPRFAPYRETLEQVRSVLSELKLKDKPDGEETKVKLLRTLRGRLSDQSLQWLDAAVVLADEEKGAKPRYAPLLGTGGNDGRLEFSNNQMKRLEEMFLSKKAKPKENAELLEAALFGTVSRFLSGCPIGQFDPGSAGGVNLSVGFEGGALLNPWYYILMNEGALVLAAAAVGRYKDPGRTGSAFPFTVTHLGAGNAKLGAEEANRQEIWLPLWETPTGYREVAALFAEGRAQIGRQQARNPVEFSIALASHGTSRGLSGFSRFGFLQRNGKSFFATPLGYRPVQTRDTAALIRQLERWLTRSRKHLQGTLSVSRLLKRYDDAVMEHLSTARKGSLAVVLERLGDLHMHLCLAPKLREALVPLPALGPDWVNLADDGSAEFRLALSVTTLGGSKTRPGLALREQLSPYDATKSREWSENGWIPRWIGRDVPERMISALRHRLLGAGKREEEAPLWGFTGASRAHLEAFLEGTIDDQRLERLIFALSLVPARSHELGGPRDAAFLPLPYLLPKMAMHQALPVHIHEGAEVVRDRDRRAPPPNILHTLASGNIGGALQASRRFLLGRSLVIPARLISPLNLPTGPCRRMAAALLFPISDNTYKHFAKDILRLESEIQRKESDHAHV